jgi:hypothetical protein
MSCGKEVYICMPFYVQQVSGSEKRGGDCRSIAGVRTEKEKSHLSRSMNRRILHVTVVCQQRSCGPVNFVHVT